MDSDGWELISAEERNSEHPTTFQIPPRDRRESLDAGDGVKLLFDIERRGEGRASDRTVQRMWVIVKARTENGYTGILDSNPDIAGNPKLREGAFILFGPEHIASIGTPPREYILKKYGASFFD